MMRELKEDYHLKVNCSQDGNRSCERGTNWSCSGNAAARLPSHHQAAVPECDLRTSAPKEVV